MALSARSAETYQIILDEAVDVHLIYAWRWLDESRESMEVVMAPDSDGSAGVVTMESSSDQQWFLLGIGCAIRWLKAHAATPEEMLDAAVEAMAERGN